MLLPIPNEQQAAGPDAVATSRQDQRRDAAGSQHESTQFASGWVAFDAAQWKAHYGDQWGRVLELKRRFDPEGVLNPGFVKYE